MTIIIPAHDEDQHLPACLAALDEAIARIDVPALAVVVLDTCRDDSFTIADTWQRARGGRAILEVTVRCVGHARKVGIEHALAALANHDRSAIWIASTDADSRVPVHWLVDHLSLANAGVDAIAGTIVVDDWRSYRDGMGERFATF
ncbi:MAG TPA: glycosyltransferase, partial [Kofleriaceae bacterium]|nr:glycosyltransferase [Kofleriaceae bacterium]